MVGMNTCDKIPLYRDVPHPTDWFIQQWPMVVVIPDIGIFMILIIENTFYLICVEL